MKQISLSPSRDSLQQISRWFKKSDFLTPINLHASRCFSEWCIIVNCVNGNATFSAVRKLDNNFVGNVWERCVRTKIITNGPVNASGWLTAVWHFYTDWIHDPIKITSLVNFNWIDARKYYRIGGGGVKCLLERFIHPTVPDLSRKSRLLNQPDCSCLWKLPLFGVYLRRRGAGRLAFPWVRNSRWIYRARTLDRGCICLGTGERESEITPALI